MKTAQEIPKKSWSPPNLLACIGFLYNVVHKIGHFWKFNRARAREIYVEERRSGDWDKLRKNKWITFDKNYATFETNLREKNWYIQSAYDQEKLDKGNEGKGKIFKKNKIKWTKYNKIKISWKEGEEEKEEEEDEEEDEEEEECFCSDTSYTSFKSHFLDPQITKSSCFSLIVH